MRLTSLAAIAACCLALAGAPLAAQTTSPATAPAPAAKSQLEIRADQVVALLNGKVEPAEIFTGAFRAAVPDAQIKALGTSLTGQFGAAQAVSLLEPHEGARAALEVRFERGVAKGMIVIDPAEGSRIVGLRFTSFDSLSVAGDTPQALVAELGKLPGTVNALFAPLDGKSAALLAVNADKPLALGSAFKLYVLAALAEDVKAQRRKWSDVVPLDQKSFPSGQLQGWPKGAPVTLHTLASLMISVSDNTATDQLIAALGRPRILKAMKDSGHADPARNTPFLTTRELFILKASDNQRIAGWRKSDAERRAAILAQVDGEQRTLDEVAAAFAGGPKALDIEWYASPADLAKLFAFLRRTGDPKAFEILTINSQATPAVSAKWRYVGFKGGSEPGVLNLTWVLTDEAGRDWIMTLGQNNEAAAVDETALLVLARRILVLPR